MTKPVVSIKSLAIYNILPILLFPLCIYLNNRNKSRVAVILSICGYSYLMVIMTAKAMLYSSFKLRKE